MDSDWQLFGHSVSSPHHSDFDQSHVASLSAWRHQSPLKMGSPCGLQSPLGMGLPWGLQSPLRMASPWGLQSPLRMASPWGISQPWRTPSPSGRSVSLLLHEPISNPNFYDTQNNFPQPQQSIILPSPHVQPHSLNRISTPSGSFVIPSIENAASRQLRTITPENMLIPVATVEESLLPAVSTRSRFSNQEWENHRLHIQKLWLEEDQSLEETKQVMKEKFNFNPS